MREGQLVLYVSPRASWCYGRVLGVDGGEVLIEPQQGDEGIVRAKAELVHCVMNAEQVDEAPDDLLDMTELHEGLLLQAVKRRYLKEVAYTDIGRISLAVNPFNFNIPWYSDAELPKYFHPDPSLLPHVWKTGRDAYISLLDTRQSQTILVSGDSGAGKTEAVKLVLKFLGAISAHKAPATDLSRTLHSKITASSPVLETFGNAKTVRNDNSSRFGKFLQVQFNAAGQICGAVTTSYLLEQSRVTTCGFQERLFHCYYQLLTSKEACKLFSLEPPDKYPILEKTAITSPRIDDAADFAATNQALRTIGMTEAQRWSIWAVIAGILHMSRVVFFDKEGSAAVVPETGKYLKLAAYAWGVESSQLEEQLITKVFNLRDSLVRKDLTPSQAAATRDSLCRGLYRRLFEWLVSEINKTMNGDKECVAWVGLLDIFGFEQFKENNLEQLCINLANEMLQNHYNNYIFTADMAESHAEGIDCQYVTFHDNTDTVEMIAGKGGILALLDDQSQVNPNDDDTLLSKITDMFESHRSFHRRQLDRSVFRVNHYAAEVPYTVAGWGNKNLDTLKENLVELMQQSKDPLIRTLLPTPTEKGKSLVASFSAQLRELLALINTTSPSWIRCIKPNSEKRPSLFDGNMVMSQLKSSGVLETVAIRKGGYPVRLQKEAFSARFRCLLTQGTSGIEATCKAVFTAMALTDADAQLGKTKVFLRSHVAQKLEVERTTALRHHVSILQQFARYKLSDFERAAASLRANEAVLKDIAMQLQMRMALVKTHDKSRNVVTDKEQEARHLIELGVVERWRGLHDDMWETGLQEAEIRNKKEAERREMEKRARIERLEAEEIAVRQQREQIKALQRVMHELYHKPSKASGEFTAAAARAAAEEALVLGRTHEEVQLIKAAMDKRAEIERVKGMEKVLQEEAKKRETDKKRERAVTNQLRSIEIKEREQDAALKRFQENEEKRRRGIIEVKRANSTKRGHVDTKLQHVRQRREQMLQNKEDAAQGALRVSEWHHVEKEFWAQTMDTVHQRVSQHGRKADAMGAANLEERKRELDSQQRKAAYNVVRNNLLRDATVEVALEQEQKRIAEQNRRDKDTMRLIKNAEQDILNEKQRHHREMNVQLSKDKAVRASSVARESQKLADQLLKRNDEKLLPSPQATPPHAHMSGSPSPMRSCLKKPTRADTSQSPISQQAYERLLGVAGKRDGYLAAAAVHTDPLAKVSSGNMAYKPVSWRT